MVPSEAGACPRRAILHSLAMCLLVLVPMGVAQSSDEPAPEPPADAYWIGPAPSDAGFAYVGFDVQEDHVLVNVTPAGGLPDGVSVDVVLLIGNDTASQPHEWYVVHFGNTTVAADFEGETPEMTPQGTAWRIAREGGAAGDCIKVVAQAWQRIDHEKQVIAALPSGADPVRAWSDLPCHEQAGQRATAPDADDPGRFAPAPALPWLVGIGIAAAMLRRR